MYENVPEAGPAPAVAGPFTLRETVVIASGVVLLIGSLLPYQLAGGWVANAWTLNAIAYNQLTTLALPVLVAAGFAWRRLSGRRRLAVGSLTLDQVGSVAAVLATAFFFISCALSMNASYLLGLIGALGLGAGTTAAPLVRAFAADFAPGAGPLLSRPVRDTLPGHGAGASAAGYATDPGAPRAGHATAAVRGPGDADAGATGVGESATGAGGSASGAGAAGTDAARTAAIDTGPAQEEAFGASRSGEAGGGPFWFAVPQTRTVVDEGTGEPAFSLHPGTWILALEDRGGEFLVQAADGRTGVLRETGNVERA